MQNRSFVKRPALPLDILIPAHKKDLQILEYCIAAAKKKVEGARRVIVISKERYSDNAEWFDEALFPFSIEMVREHVGKSSGWYFQQLLKLYAPTIIPNISENVLILDSDTVFFRRVKMLDTKGRAYYNISKEKCATRRKFDQRVAAHAEKMLPILATKNLPPEFQNISGISHNMVFNHEILRDLFARVEAHHNSSEPFYKIFLKFSDELHSASEYQIYFNFLLIYHKEKILIKKLCFKNTADIDIRKYRKRFKYHYCSFHSYLRGPRAESLRAKSERFAKDFIYKLFCLEVWNVGIARCNIGTFVNLPNHKIEWLRHSQLTASYANPAGLISNNNEKNIFLEQKNHFFGGTKIYNLRLNDQLEIIDKKEVLKNCSLAHIFYENEQKFALVKNHKTKNFAIHAICAANGFEKIADLLHELEMINPSIKKHDGKWWLFFAKKGQKDNQLHIAFSDNLKGEWKMHSQNPISLDAGSAHHAGEIFSYRDSLFRPARNQHRSFGQSIALNKIVALGQENYQEILETEIFSNQLGNWPDGINSIASLGENLTLLSGKKFAFAPHKSFIFLTRIFFGRRP